MKSLKGLKKEVRAEFLSMALEKEYCGFDPFFNTDIFEVLDDGFRVPLGKITLDDFIYITLGIAEYAVKNLGGESLPEAENCISAARERLVKVVPGVVPAFKTALHTYGCQSKKTERANLVGTAATNAFFGVLGQTGNAALVLAEVAEAAGLEDEGIYSILKMKEYARQSNYILNYLESKSQYN
jgi:hypothetical protein